MKNKGHFTPEGLSEIREVKSGMNTGRAFTNSLLNSDASSKVPRKVQKLSVSKSLNTPRIQKITFSSQWVKVKTNCNESRDTQLVVRGTNLGSRGGCDNYRVCQSKIPPYYYNIFVGLLLSDGWLSEHSKTKPNLRLKFRQPYSQAEVIWYVLNNISHYCERSPYYYSGLRKGKYLHHILIRTCSFPYFTELYSVFFFNKKKRLPENIYDLLTPLALAYWIIGSGVKLQGRGLLIYTDSFSIPEVVTLINVLIIKYRLVCKMQLDKDIPRIYISKNYMGLLMSIIKPHISTSVLREKGL